MNPQTVLFAFCVCFIGGFGFSQAIPNSSSTNPTTKRTPVISITTSKPILNGTTTPFSFPDDFEDTDATLNATAAPLFKICPYNGGAKRWPDGFTIACNNLYKLCDRNKDHQVSEHEFEYKSYKVWVSTRELSKAFFALYDLDTDGFIDISDDPLIFDRLDFDNNNKVTRNDYLFTLQKLRTQAPFVVLLMRTFKRFEGHRRIYPKLTRRMFSNLFDSLWRSAHGSVSRNAFVSEWVQKMDIRTFEAKYNFDELDTDKDGFITKKELENLFEILDRNGDKAIEALEIGEMGIVHPKYVSLYVIPDNR